MVLMRTIVFSSRFSSEPISAARSASDGSCPSEFRSFSRAASSSRRTRRTPRGQASLRNASIIAPRMRRSAKVSNLIPRPSSKRWAASIRPMTPSWTRSLRSTECGMVDAMRRASASTKGSPASTRRFVAGLRSTTIFIVSPHCAVLIHTHPFATWVPRLCSSVVQRARLSKS